MPDQTVGTDEPLAGIRSRSVTLTLKSLVATAVLASFFGGALGSALTIAVAKDGPRGAVGTAGAEGPGGLDGLDGSDGSDGAEGATGPSGETGAQGELGPQGPAGLQGQAGPTGKAANAGDLQLNMIPGWPLSCPYPRLKIVSIPSAQAYGPSQTFSVLGC